MKYRIGKASRPKFETVPYRALGSAELHRARLVRYRIHRELAAAYAAAPWGSDLSEARRAADEAWAAYLEDLDLSDPKDAAFLDRKHRRGAGRVGLRYAPKRLAGVLGMTRGDLLGIALFLLGLLLFLGAVLWLGEPVAPKTP
jgi:hypothetical protein